ncbi:MAG: aminopeptidase [Anaerolineae bacterium]|nr:aminopeptidase [Anaerolineae bacterium]
MSDPRIEKFAHILVNHSARIQPGDRVLIEASTVAEPLVKALYANILQQGGHPHLQLNFPDQAAVFYTHANQTQLEFTPTFRKLAYDEFESRIRIHSETNPRALTHISPDKQARHQKALASILATQMRRGAAKEFKWVTTLYPTEAYAKEANMDYESYKDFVYQACFADENTPDPMAAWKEFEARQQKIIQQIEGHDKVKLRGPNVDLTLSIRGRTFKNSFGEHNMPDGEIYTGPVESSLNGWVRYTYPAITGGRVVEGVELAFKDGRVTQATAQTNQDFLNEMLNTDPGARYIGEFAIGTNYNIDRFIGHILFDEKIGGTFHMALGAGYPETGSQNKSAIHWDMICDLQHDSEILVDGELVYKNGQFII